MYGVARLADERDGGVALAVDRGHDAERLAQPLQHRPLLDVDLGVRNEVVASRERGVAGEEVLQRDAILVAQLEPGRVEAADDRRRPQVRGPEAQALLVGEAIQLDRAVGHALDRRERDEHAERPVVAAGVAHGVQVRAEHERPADAAAPDHVADRVLADVETGGEHPAADELLARRIASVP